MPINYMLNGKATIIFSSWIDKNDIVILDDYNFQNNILIAT